MAVIFAATPGARTLGIPAAMPISDLHAAHIRRVNVGFVVSAPDLDPDAITRETGLAPHRQARRGDPRRNVAGTLLKPHDEGWWRLDSEPAVTSKDINVHLQHLLDLLLPHAEFLRAVGCGSFDVLWESTYLYAGTGPLMNRQVCAGVAALGAELGFDIYQIDEAAPEES